MKIFTSAQIRELDKYTIEHEPISSADLMERAARAIVRAIADEWGASTPVVVFAGPGNNGGDALAVARLLAEAGYSVSAYLFNITGKLSADCAANKERLVSTKNVRQFVEVAQEFDPPQLDAATLVVDGLFGSGLNKPLAGGFASLVKYINASPAKTVSIDVPSGLMGEDNTYNIAAHIVRADLTLSLQLPKLAFLFAENEAYVGEWRLLDIGLSEEAIDETDTDFELADDDEVASLLRPRGRFAHKGSFGRALLIAGSQGMAGASILSARGCLRSGAGLLTVHVPFCNNFMVQSSVPEAMTELDYSETRFSEPTDTDDYQAVGIGPGLGRDPQTVDAVLEQIRTCQTPMVVDADALNALGEHRSGLNDLPEGSILTPHPKELERLVGKCHNSYERLMKARELAQNTGAHIVLKGAYTAVVSPDGRCWFNTTGNPGMATGGSGDVLTGVLLALLAQGYDAGTAARLGVYVHGLAGDIAARKQGRTGMTAGDIATCLPLAWKLLEEKDE